MFGTSFERGPLWPVRLSRSVGPKCPLPFYLTKLLSPVPLFCILLGSGLCNRNVPLHWARGISEISNRNFCWMELWKALLVSIFELLSLAEGGQFATINQSIDLLTLIRGMGLPRSSELMYKTHDNKNTKSIKIQCIWIQNNLKGS